MAERGMARALLASSRQEVKGSRLANTRCLRLIQVNFDELGFRFPMVGVASGKKRFGEDVSDANTRDKGNSLVCSIIGGFENKAFLIRSGASASHADQRVLLTLSYVPGRKWLTPTFPECKRKGVDLRVTQQVRKVVVRVLYSAEDIRERRIPVTDLIDPSRIHADQNAGSSFVT